MVAILYPRLQWVKSWKTLHKWRFFSRLSKCLGNNNGYEYMSLFCGTKSITIDCCLKEMSENKSKSCAGRSVCNNGVKALSYIIFLLLEIVLYGVSVALSVSIILQLQRHMANYRCKKALDTKPSTRAQSSILIVLWTFFKSARLHFPADLLMFDGIEFDSSMVGSMVGK